MTDLARLLLEAAGSTTSEPDLPNAHQRARSRVRRRRSSVATVIACATALGLGAVLLFSGEGGSSPSVRVGPSAGDGRRTISSNIEVSLPDGWKRSPTNILPSLMDPQLVFAAATYPLAATDHNCAQIPVNALEQLGPSDAFVWITQRSGPVQPEDGFAARPATITSTSGDDALQGDLPTCLDHPLRGTARTLRMVTNGQALYVNWATGTEISDTRLAELSSILDRFRAVGNGMRPGTARITDCVNTGANAVTVPDVIGMRLGPAIRVMESAGLNVVGYGTPPTDPIERMSRVRSAKPAAGERVPRGACIGFRTN